MKLVWQQHPKQANKYEAASSAYQYTLIDYNDGRSEMSVQHRGDSPSATPIKRFPYKNHRAAIGGAQRFEDKHGYRDPAHHSPAEIVPFLPELPERITRVIDSKAQDAEAATRLASQVLAAEAHAEYHALCDAVLCCRVYDCHNRTEIGQPHCAEHTNDMKEEQR
jgi:hypothetical protein